MTNPNELQIQVRRISTRSGSAFFEARLVPAGAEAADDPGEVVAYRRSAPEAEEAARVERTRREARTELFAANLAFLSEEAHLPLPEKKIVGLFRARRRAEP